MIAQIRPSDFLEWCRAQAQTPVVLDVREAWEVQTASIKTDGFELVHIPMGEIPSKLSFLDSAAPVACLCHHGARSQRVAQFLVQNGFTNVSNIAGGIAAWAQTVDTSVAQY